MKSIETKAQELRMRTSWESTSTAASRWQQATEIQRLPWEQNRRLTWRSSVIQRISKFRGDYSWTETKDVKLVNSRKKRESTCQHRHLLILSCLFILRFPKKPGIAKIISNFSDDLRLLSSKKKKQMDKMITYQMIAKIQPPPPLAKPLTLKNKSFNIAPITRIIQINLATNKNHYASLPGDLAREGDG